MKMLKSLMNKCNKNVELLTKVEYLLFKYLEKKRADFIFSEFKHTLKKGRNTGKHCLHVLSTEKVRDIEDIDKKTLKEVAFQLGV